MAASLVNPTCKSQIDWTVSTDETIQLGFETDSIAVEKYKSWLGTHGKDAAAEMMVEWLRSQSGVATVDRTESGDVWVYHENGVPVGILLAEEDGDTLYRGQPGQGDASGGVVRQQHLVTQFYSLLAPVELIQSANEVAKAIGGLPGCSGIAPSRYPTSVAYLRDERLRLDGLFFLDSHGTVTSDEADTGICFGERRTPETAKAYKDHIDKREVLQILPARYWYVTTRFFRDYPPKDDTDAFKRLRFACLPFSLLQ